MKWNKRRCTNIKDKEAFVYLVKFENNEFYIGYKKFKTIKNSETNWKVYNTSSKYVKEHIKSGIAAKWIILKTFDDYIEALKYEEFLIRKYFHNIKCLNKSIGGYKFNKYPDTPEHLKKLSIAHKGKILSKQHKASISSSMALYCREHTRSNEHVHNNINSRKTKCQVSIKLKNRVFRSYKKAALYLGCNEDEVKYHPSVLDIKTTIHRVPEYVVVDNVKYGSFVEAARKLDMHPSAIKNFCMSSEHPNFIVSYKRV